jgi:hypothetical protein
MILDENVENKRKMLAWVGFYSRIGFIVIFSLTTSIMSLFILLKIGELTFLKIKNTKKH